jgi:hypothetical protein
VATCRADAASSSRIHRREGPVEWASHLEIAGARVLCLPSIVSVTLALGSPPADAVTPTPAGARVDVARPLAAPAPSRPLTATAGLPTDGAAPLTTTLRAGPELASDPPRVLAPLRAGGSAGRVAPETGLPRSGVAPLDTPAGDVADPWAPAGTTPATRRPRVAAPFGTGPALKLDPPDPRRLHVLRIELLTGPVWRIRTTETQLITSLEAGRLQGFSGTFHLGVIVAPDREAVSVSDFPIGAGFVARRLLGRRSLSGSVGLTAGVLVHRAVTDFGLLHRVDPDFQLPLRFAWTVGPVGLSLAILQGFSARERAYYRRGVEVWQRIAYRVGVAIGLHFEIGVGGAGSRRAARRRQTP